MSAPLSFSVDGRQLVFEQVPLHFVERRGITNVFAEYDAKTLRQTLQKRRYSSTKGLVQETMQKYADYLDWPLGSFLLELKQGGDESKLYAAFLNKYGDLQYCRFSIDGDLVGKKGLYCYTVDGSVKYIGRCRDSFNKRVNQGYGVIHPKNCYLDGQATNCHINFLIATATGKIGFWVCPLESDAEIKALEERLIKDPSRQLDWNIALKGEQPGVQDAPAWVRPVFVAGVFWTLLGLALVVMSLSRWEQSQ